MEAELELGDKQDLVARVDDFDLPTHDLACPQTYGHCTVMDSGPHEAANLIGDQRGKKKIIRHLEAHFQTQQGRSHDAYKQQEITPAEHDLCYKDSPQVGAFLAGRKR